MKIVFMGTPEFAVASLDALTKSKHEVVAVVTVPDKPAGRGKKIKTSAVKDYALENNIPILQPDKLKNPEFIDSLLRLNADLFVVVAFRMLPEIVWKIPPKGTFNIHGSLLPQYRGAAPINHAIINGEKESGLTTFMIDEKIDTGRIILQKKIDIHETENAGSLHDRLMELSKEIVIETCNILEENKLNLIPQKELEKNIILNPAPKIFKQDCHLSTDIKVKKAQQLIRGLSPYPAAFVELVSPENKAINLKIYEATTLLNKISDKGKIETDNKTYIKLCFEDGQLEITDLQLQSKKRMKTVDFLRGFNINNDWIWR